ncbi:MAG: c-type cytochrome [Gemmatimonadales bacterium]
MSKRLSGTAVRLVPSGIALWVLICLSAQSAGAQELRDAYHTAPLDTVPRLTYEGWKQFNLNCARCHGEDALGTSFAPHLILSLKPDGPIPTQEIFIQTVCGGRPEKGMPSWCALGMEIDKIQAIYAYVKGRSDARIRPGRPAIRKEG